MLSITVDTLVDEADGSIVDGDVSLRDAIALAPSGETIDFSVSGTINLTNLGDLLINKDLTIAGPGADVLTIRAFDPTPAVKNGNGRRVFNIDDGTTTLRTVAISGLTLTGGDISATVGHPAFANGGGIRSLENLMIADSVISGNSAGTFGDFPRHQKGGGIYSANGSLSVINSTISGNMADDGGGIRSNGEFFMSGSTVSGNSTGGIRSDGHTVIESSTISGNAGGGIAHFGGISTLTVTGSEIIGNTAAAGIRSDGQTTVVSSNISGNTGVHAHGIYHYSGELSVIASRISNNAGTGIGMHDCELVVSDSTISGNEFSGIVDDENSDILVTRSTINGNNRGGIHGGYGGSVTVVECTVSGNGAVSPTDAGVSSSFGTIAIRHSTITKNQTGVASNQGSAEVYASIISGNISSDVVSQYGGPNSFHSLGYNLIGTGNAIGEFIEPGDQVGVDPMLAPLADNGGPTMTHALLLGSPAIDAGDPAAVAGVGDVPEFDQRGAPFTRVYDGDPPEDIAIDIGAFELQPLPPAFFGDYNLSGIVDAADYTAWRDTLGAVVTNYSGADGDGDGTIDQDDYDVWKSHFGESLPPGAGGGAGAVATGARSVASDSTVSIEPTVSFLGIDESVQRSAEPGTGNSARAAGGPALVRLRTDDALLAWLAARSTERANDDPSSVKEPAVEAADARLDSLDLHFARIGGGL